MSNFKEDLNKVKAFVFDVDGVFTDSMLYCMADGEQVRAMNAKDGFAVRFAQKQGFPIGIISAGQNNVGTIKRLQYLDIEDLYMGSFEKTEAIQLFAKKHNIPLDEILYMGDDIPDYPVLKMVGIPTCPGDAAIEIKQVSKYISNVNGGQGCVRDVIEQVLRAQSLWVNLNVDKPNIL
jgi:3-deoxy-D-manno-octulosonate 8-phosphate phosphatase (KDO 8-P phosphatase)